MSKKLFWKYVLPGIIALALPIGAMAQPYDVELLTAPTTIGDVADMMTGTGNGVLDAAVILNVDSTTDGEIYVPSDNGTASIGLIAGTVGDFIFIVPSITLTGVRGYLEIIFFFFKRFADYRDSEKFLCFLWAQAVARATPCSTT